MADRRAGLSYFARALLVALALAVAFVAALFVMMPLKAKAAEPANCTPVDAASLIWTRQGWSMAIGDGHVIVLHDRVRYWDGPLAYCIPATGMPLLFLPSSGWLQFAHGAYAWINDFNYKDAFGVHCCGAADCVEINPADVTERPDGFHWRDRVVNKKAVYPSRDGKAWLCRIDRCLFIPGGF